MRRQSQQRGLGTLQPKAAPAPAALVHRAAGHAAVHRHQCFHVLWYALFQSLHNHVMLALHALTVSTAICQDHHLKSLRAYIETGKVLSDRAEGGLHGCSFEQAYCHCAFDWHIEEGS